jgi:hypothetical protein
MARMNWNRPFGGYDQTMNDFFKPEHNIKRKKPLRNKAIMTKYFQSAVNTTDTVGAVMVKLTPHDVKVLEEALILVIEYKDRTLKRPAWTRFSTEWLPRVIDQLARNELEVNHPQKNTPLWIVDQICWSNKLTAGVNPTQCIPLADTSLGEQAMAICRAAARGQEHYDLWRKNSKFHDLFA